MAEPAIPPAAIPPAVPPDRPARDWANLRLRLISAAVLVPLTLLLLRLGGAGWAGLIALFGIAGIREWVRMVDPRSGIAATMLGGMGMAMVALGTVVDGAGAGLAAIVATIVVTGVAWTRRQAAPLRELLFGPLYVGATVMSLIWLRQPAHGGLDALLFLLAIVWLGDTGAFVAGSWLKGPKLWPSLSPRKTWAGVAGGLGVAALTGLVMALILRPSQAVPLTLVALLLGAVGQAGDLFESAIKRKHGVKDSGHTIPGHGGVLDRVDALLAAAPVLAAIVALRSGF